MPFSSMIFISSFLACLLVHSSICISGSVSASRELISLHMREPSAHLSKSLPLSSVISVESEGFHLHGIQQACLLCDLRYKYCEALHPACQIKSPSQIETGLRSILAFSLQQDICIGICAPKDNIAFRLHGIQQPLCSRPILGQAQPRCITILFDPA